MNQDGDDDDDVQYQFQHYIPDSPNPFPRATFLGATLEARADNIVVPFFLFVPPLVSWFVIVIESHFSGLVFLPGKKPPPCLRSTDVQQNLLRTMFQYLNPQNKVGPYICRLSFTSSKNFFSK
jgi:hypothetical protein